MISFEASICANSHPPLAPLFSCLCVSDGAGKRERGYWRGVGGLAPFSGGAAALFANVKSIASNTLAHPSCV